MPNDAEKTENYVKALEADHAIRAHPSWKPELHTVPQVDTFLFQVKKRAWIAIGSLAASMIACGFAAYLLATDATKPRPMIGVTASGWTFSNAPRAYVKDTDKEEKMWRQIVEAHFVMTEKGMYPGLADYSTPDTMAKVAEDFKRSTENNYEMSLAIYEVRILGRSSTEAALAVRGKLISSDTKLSQTSDVYLSCILRVRQPTAKNPLGWRLMGCNELNRDEFYYIERQKERQELLGIKPADGAPQ